VALSVAAMAVARAEDYDEDLPAILSVTFRGNATFGAGDLLKQTTLDFPSLSHPFRARPRFRRNGFSKELRRIEDYYHRQGFGGVNAQLDSIVSEQSGRSVRLQVGIREGPRTHIREVRFLPQPVFSLEELRAIVPFKTGDPYPFSAAERGRATRALRLAFLSRGYLAVSVRDSSVVSADSSAALLLYQMAPGNQFRVRSVSISGNLRTLPAIVQREIKIHPGQVYSYALVEQSKQNLYSTGLFRSVVIREDDPDPVASTVDLSVRLTERQNAYVEGAVGFGRRDAFEVTASTGWGHRNLWGRGHGLGVSAEVAYNIEEGGDRWYTQEGVHYKYPHVFNTAVRFAPDVTFTIDQRQSAIHLQEWRINAPFTYELGRFTTIGTGASVALSKSSVEDIAEKPQNTLGTRLIYAAINQNYTDNVFNPRTGDVRSLRVERAGFWGETYFTRLSGSYTRFVPLGRNVLAFDIRAGWVEAYGPSREPQALSIGIQGVPFEYLFQAGGSSTVRGFDTYSLGTPIQVTEFNASGGTATVDTVDVHAGTVLLIGNVELRRLAPLLSRWNVNMALFIDAGNAWEDLGAFKKAQFGPGFRDDSEDDPAVSDLRYSYGFGLRYPTPFGPIRVDVGFPAKKFGKRRFHFAVGYPF
jgi:outer membrane protein insertion porin family